MDNWIIMALFSIVACLAAIISQLRNDVTKLNDTLQKIAKHIGVQEISSSNVDEELRELLSQGKKIKAIKIYRDATGAGLKEAKEHVDSLEERINEN